MKRTVATTLVTAAPLSAALWLSGAVPLHVAELRVEIAAVLLRKLCLQIANTSRGGTEPQVGQRRQGLVGPFVVEVRVAVVGAEEAVTDANLIVAAVVFIVANENVELLIECHVVNVA